MPTAAYMQLNLKDITSCEDLKSSSEKIEALMRSMKFLYPKVALHHYRSSI